MAFLMKYEGAYEAIQVVIPEIESPEETAVKLATHGKGNNTDSGVKNVLAWCSFELQFQQA